VKSPDDFVFVQRHRALFTDDYWCEIDEYRRASGEQFLLAHLRVARWAPSVLKRFHREWSLFRTVVTAPIFAYAGEDAGDKWVKFVTRFGFRPLHQTINCNNGAQRPIFIHTVSPKDAK
jgi:hypothetical protein